MFSVTSPSLPPAEVLAEPAVLAVLVLAVLVLVLAAVVLVLVAAAINQIFPEHQTSHI